MTKLYKELLLNYFNMYPQITIIFLSSKHVPFKGLIQLLHISIIMNIVLDSSTCDRQLNDGTNKLGIVKT